MSIGSHRFQQSTAASTAMAASLGQLGRAFVRTLLLIRRGFNRAVLPAGVLAFAQLAQAQSTTVDVLKPGKITQVVSGPIGFYESPEIAFAAYKAWQEDPATCTLPYKCSVSNLRACANNGTFFWGYPSQWCHDWSTTYAGQPYASGVTSVMSVFEACSAGYSMVNTAPVSGTGATGDPRYYEMRCERTRPQQFNKQCGVGNPIYPAIGLKRQLEVDYVSPSRNLRFARAYDSETASFREEFDLGFLAPVKGATTMCMGGVVTLWDQQTGQYKKLPLCFERLNVDTTKASFINEIGVKEDFSWNGSSGTPTAAYFNDRLIAAQVSGQAGYLLTRVDEGRYYLFDALGHVQAVTDLTGDTVTLSYSTATTPASTAPGPGYLIGQTDAFGRAFQLAYAADGSLTSLTDPAGQGITYAYSAVHQATGIPSARLSLPSSVRYQDGATKAYVWDEAAWSTGSSPGTGRLTGIVDELAARYASFGYSNGSAISTEHAGAVDRFALVDQRNSSGVGSIVLTQPNGATSTQNYVLVNGLPRLAGNSQPAGSGCSASTGNQTFDANGKVASKDDFNGTRACFASDLSRNLETTRVEGLSTSATCSAVTAANAVLPSGSRKVSTAWHPNWRLEIQVAEPGRITTSVYNGQPDPFNANAAASCAPSTALLPDGKPIAVLCKQVQEATTDVDGHLGFTAALQSGVANRVQSWTYNGYGQVLTATDPLNHTTTYAYYADTFFTRTDPNAVGHTIGDLQTVTNAVGKVTTYTQYDKHGNLLQSSDPNGVVTVNTYDLRQRLLSTSVAGQTTSYSYDPAGQLLKVTAPDASWIGYEYDPAHRLTATKDNLGNRIEYTLDNAGNRIAQNVKDPGGSLARTLARSIDALGRVQQTTGRE